MADMMAADAIDQWLTDGHDIRRLTCSSDGGGCIPVFDGDGELLQMGIGRSEVLAQTIAELLRMGHALPSFLPIFTANVARVLRMPSKGRIGLGSDADLVALDQDGRIKFVMARGQWMLRDGDITRRGPFEDC